MGEKMGTVVNFQNVYCFSELKTFASILKKNSIRSHALG